MEITVSIIGALLLVFPLWKIFQKSGMQPAWSLLIFLPAIGLLICAFILAFAEWPSLAKHSIKQQD